MESDGFSVALGNLKKIKSSQNFFGAGDTDVCQESYLQELLFSLKSCDVFLRSSAKSESRTNFVEVLSFSSINSLLNTQI